MRIFIEELQKSPSAGVSPETDPP